MVERGGCVVRTVGGMIAMTGHEGDASKLITADFRHRALRHHAEGIFLCEQVFGTTFTDYSKWAARGFADSGLCLATQSRRT